jgi:cytochrome oxidase Cu insertion factor (SCO1/SenC/PrrC family)
MKNKRNDTKRMKQTNHRRKGRKLPWVVGIIAIVFLSLFSLQWLNEKQTNTAGLRAGTPAPEFTLTSTKEEISLSDFKGKNVVLYFYEGNS